MDVDAILPLTMTPEPSAVSRVFVGRMELVTPATIRDVTAALDAGDSATLKMRPVPAADRQPGGPEGGGRVSDNFVSSAADSILSEASPLDTPAKLRRCPP